MSLYLDTSVLLKLLFDEPESAQTQKIARNEAEIIVSSLARLEALIRIEGACSAGSISRRQATERRATLDRIIVVAPFRRVSIAVALFQVAEAQLKTRHCKTLDRLHLAVMEMHNLRRLFTNDDQQASAARALGFEVTLPR